MDRDFLIIILILMIFYLLREYYRIREKELREKQKNDPYKKNYKLNYKKDSYSVILRGQTENVRYYLFDTIILRKELKSIYQRLIKNNLWLNEPFHSKLFELLLILNSNSFMIPDPNSRIITMYYNGKTSKSFQVFSTIDVIDFVIEDTTFKINTFSKHDAQNITLAIFIIAIEKSLHYKSKIDSKNIIDKLLKEYKCKEYVYCIINLIKDENTTLDFVNDSFNIAIYLCKTYPYNTSEIKKEYKLDLKLPKRRLEQI
jgi:hypothetical protein